MGKRVKILKIKVLARVFTILLACLSLYTACGGGDDGGMDDFFSSSDFLNVPSQITIGGNQTQATIEVSSNCSWTITGMPSWFSVSPASGNGNVKVNLSIQSNPSALESRSAVLTISTPDGLKFEIQVTQSAATESLTLDVDKLDFTSDGGTQSIAVHNNSRWTVTGITDWLMLDRTSGDGNMDITLTVYANTTESVRSTVLTVQGVSSSASVTVTQDQRVTTLSLTPEKVTIDAGQNQVPVTLSGDASWTASSDAVWATPDQLTGNGGTTVRIMCDMNNSVNARSAIITFKTSRAVLTCTITQSGGAAPVLSAPVIDEVTKYSAKVSGTYSSPFEVTEYGICLSRNHNPGLNDTKVTFGDNNNTSGSFTTTMSELESDATYYVRSYAVNSYGTSYSEEVSFTTLGSKPDQDDNTPPALTPKR